MRLAAIKQIPDYSIFLASQNSDKENASENCIIEMLKLRDWI